MSSKFYLTKLNIEKRLQVNSSTLKFLYEHQILGREEYFPRKTKTILNLICSITVTQFFILCSRIILHAQAIAKISFICSDFSCL